MYNQTVPLSVRSKGHFLGPWVYAQTAIECTLKGLFFGSLSVFSKGHFLGPWTYAQTVIECSHNRSYAQGVIRWVLEQTLRGSFFGSLICWKSRVNKGKWKIVPFYCKMVCKIILQTYSFPFTISNFFM